MKKLFRKFFSLDEPAKGAFFGLTVLMAWLWLIFTGLCLFWDYLFFNQLHRLHYNVIQFSWVVMTLLGLVSTALCIAPLYALCLKENGFIRRHRYGFLVASSLYCLAFTFLVILDLLDIEYLFAIYALIVLLHMGIGIALQRGASIRKKVMFGLLCPMI